MSKHRDFNTNDVLPAGWSDAFHEYVGALVSNLDLRRNSDTVVEIPAGTGNDQVTLAIAGKWRFNSTTATASMPAGGAGVYNVWAKSQDNIAAQEDAGTFNYGFSLEIRATVDGAPTSHALSRLIGTVEWNGTMITSIRQSAGRNDIAPIQPTAPAAGYTPVRVRAGAAQSADLVRYESSTGALLSAVRSDGTNLCVASGSTPIFVNRQVAADANPTFQITAAGEHEWGVGGVTATDVRLYRAAADVLGLDDELRIGRADGSTVLSGRVTADTQPRLRMLTSGELAWGPGNATVDTNLYRRIADVLKTDDTFEALAYRVGTTPLASTHLADAANLARLNVTNAFTQSQSFVGLTSSLGIDVTRVSDLPAIRGLVGAEATPRMNLSMSRLEFGSGSAAADSRIERVGGGTPALRGVAGVYSRRIVDTGGYSDFAYADIGNDYKLVSNAWNSIGTHNSGWFYYSQQAPPYTYWESFWRFHKFGIGQTRYYRVLWGWNGGGYTIMWNIADLGGNGSMWANFYTQTLGNGNLQIYVQGNTDNGAQWDGQCSHRRVM